MGTHQFPEEQAIIRGPFGLSSPLMGAGDECSPPVVFSLGELFSISSWRGTRRKLEGTAASSQPRATLASVIPGAWLPRARNPQLWTAHSVLKSRAIRLVNSGKVLFALRFVLTSASLVDIS